MRNAHRTTVYVGNMRITRETNYRTPEETSYRVKGEIADILNAGLCRTEWLPVPPKRRTHAHINNPELAYYSITRVGTVLDLDLWRTTGRFQRHCEALMARGQREETYEPPDMAPSSTLRKAALQSTLGRHDTLGYGRFLARVFNGRNLPDWRPDATEA